MRLEHFQMIDRVLAADGESLSAEARVPENSPVFEGHFPGHPLVPGVLLVETMAQAAGYMLLRRTGFARMPFLASVNKAKLRAFVPPGALLAVGAKLVHEGSGYAVAAGRIEAEDGKRVCDAELTLRVSPAACAAARPCRGRSGSACSARAPAPSPAR